MTAPSLREAATMALEALDRASATLGRYDIPGTQNWIVSAMQPALESLRAALAIPAANPVDTSVCMRCNGSGEAIAMTNHLGPGDYECAADCPACGGTGEPQPAPVELKPLDLTAVDALARAYCANYYSPHHVAFSVDGLRNLIEAAQNIKGAA